MDGGVMLVAGERKRAGMRVAWSDRLRSRLGTVVAAAAAGLVLASCTSAPPGPGAASPGSGVVSRSGGVISLTGISTLKSLFNRDNGHPRLVLIFSPT
jgi:hypothetical protein